MKNRLHTHWLRAAAVAFSLLLVACDRTTDDVAPETADVPQAVVKGLLAQFPAATEVKFYAIEKNETWGSAFNLQRIPHEAVISQSGKVLEALRVAATADLPATIQAYIAQNYPGFVVQKFVETPQPPKQYRVLISNGQKTFTLLFDANGKLMLTVEVIDPKPANPTPRYSVKFDDLPAAIKSALDGYQFRTALVSGTGDNKRYEVSAVKGNLAYYFYFDANGKLLKSSSTPYRDSKTETRALQKSDLPAAIVGYLDANYPGYAFEKAALTVENGNQVSYLVVIRHGGSVYYLYFNREGKFEAVKKG